MITITIAHFTGKPYLAHFTFPFCFALVASGSAQLTVLELVAAITTAILTTSFRMTTECIVDSETDLTVLVPNNDAIDAYTAAMGMTTADFIASESAVDMALYHIVPNEAAVQHYQEKVW